MNPQADARPMTLRQHIVDLLTAGPMTAKDLSRAAGVRERAVYDHLAHIARSAPHRGERLTVTPAECLACGYRFDNRRRLTPPGRCPRCRQSRLSPPVYCIRPL